MPFKSEAQRRKFGEMVKQGKISEGTFQEWNKETGKKKLPERIGPKTTSTKPRSPKTVEELRKMAKAASAQRAAKKK